MEKEVFIHKVTLENFTDKNQQVPSIECLLLTLSWQVQGLCQKASENSIQFNQLLSHACVSETSVTRVIFPTEDEGADTEVTSLHWEAKQG